MHLPYFLIATLAIYLATAKLESDTSSAETTTGKDEVDSYHPRYSGKAASHRYSYPSSYRYSGSTRYSRSGSRYSGSGSRYGSGLRRRYYSTRYTGSRYVPRYRYRVDSRYRSYRTRYIPRVRYTSRYRSYRTRYIPSGKSSSRYRSRYNGGSHRVYRQGLYNTGK